MIQTEALKSSRLYCRLSPLEQLGFVIEVAPMNSKINLTDILPYASANFMLRGDIKSIFSREIDPETLVLVDDLYTNITASAEKLCSLPVANIGLIINRSYPLSDSTFSEELAQKFQSRNTSIFLHFPIAESEFEPNWSLDEIFLFLVNSRHVWDGPKHYRVFDPIWKYESAEVSLSRSTSIFHSTLSLRDYEAASKESVFYSNFRSLLQSSDSIKTKLLKLVLLELPDLFLKAKAFSLKYFYWPLEYHLRTWRKPLTAQAYEQLKTQEIQQRRDLKFNETKNKI